MLIDVNFNPIPTDFLEVAVGDKLDVRFFQKAMQVFSTSVADTEPAHNYSLTGCDCQIFAHRATRDKLGYDCRSSDCAGRFQKGSSRDRSSFFFHGGIP